MQRRFLIITGFFVLLCLGQIVFAQETPPTPETKQNEDEAKKKAEEEAAKKLAEEEAAKKKAEEEAAAKKLAEEEAAKKEAEIQKRWMEYAVPGTPHEHLMPLVGEWNISSKFWMPNQTEPLTSAGTSTAEWILGGRYLEEHHKSEFMGAPFQGRSLLGYDNYLKQYQSIWIDSMGTGVSMSQGTADETGKVLTFKGKMVDPGMQTILDTRAVVRIKNYMEHTFEMYILLPDGKEFKMMEMEYKRK